MQDRGSCLCHNFHNFIFQDSANIEIFKNNASKRFESETQLTKLLRCLSLWTNCNVTAAFQWVHILCHALRLWLFLTLFLCVQLHLLIFFQFFKWNRYARSKNLASFYHPTPRQLGKTFKKTIKLPVIGVLC